MSVDSPDLLESDEVSDVNPDELAAMLSELDDDLLGSSSSKPITPKPPALPSSSSSSSSKTPIKPTIKTPDKSKSLTKNNGKGTPTKKVTFGSSDNSETDVLSKSERLLKNDFKKPSLKNDTPSPGSTKTNSPATTSSSPSVSSGKKKADLSDFVSNLFSDESSKSNTKELAVETKSPIRGATSDKMTARKSKNTDDLFGSDNFFDKSLDDNDDNSYMSNLLGGTSGKKKPQSTASTKEFVLDDRYKTPQNKTTTAKNEDLFGGYKPSDDRKQPSQRPAKAPTRKPAIDDDIFSENIFSYKTGGSSGGSGSSSSGGGGGRDRGRRRQATNKYLDEGEQEEEEPREEDQNPTNSDWLGSMLSGKSPKATPKKEAAAKSPKVSSGTPTPTNSAAHVPQVPNIQMPMLTAPVLQMQSLAQAGVVASTELQAQLQEQLSQQQQRAMQHLEEQQKQLEEQFVQQTKQQIAQQQQMAELLNKQQEAAVTRFQRSLASLSNFGVQLNTDEQDSGLSQEKLKNLQVMVHDAQVQAESLAAEVKILRERHEEQIQLLKKSYEHHMELSAEINAKREALLSQETESMQEQLEKKVEQLRKELTKEREQYEERVKQVHESSSTAMEQLQLEHKKQLQQHHRIRDMEVEAVKRAVREDTAASEVLRQLHTNTNSLSALSDSMEQQRAEAQEAMQKSLVAHQHQVQVLQAQLSAAQQLALEEKEKLQLIVKSLEERLSKEAQSLQQNWTLQKEYSKMQEENKILEGQVVQLHQQIRQIKDGKSMAAAAEQMKLEQERVKIEQSIAQLKMLQYQHTLSNSEDKSADKQASAIAAEAIFEEKMAVRRLRERLDEERALLDQEREELHQNKMKIAFKEADVLKAQDNLKVEQMKLERLKGQLQHQQRELQNQLQLKSFTDRRAQHNLQYNNRLSELLSHLSANSTRQPVISTSLPTSHLNNNARLLELDLRPSAVLARLAAARQLEESSSPTSSNS